MIVRSLACARCTTQNTVKHEKGILERERQECGMKDNEIGLLPGGVSTSSRDLQSQAAGRADIGTELTFIATYGRRIVESDKRDAISTEMERWD